MKDALFQDEVMHPNENRNFPYIPSKDSEEHWTPLPLAIIDAGDNVLLKSTHLDGCGVHRMNTIRLSLLEIFFFSQRGGCYGP